MALGSFPGILMNHCVHVALFGLNLSVCTGRDYDNVFFKFSLLTAFYSRIVMYIYFQDHVIHENIGVVSVLISLHVGTLALVLTSTVGI